MEELVGAGRTRVCEYKCQCLRETESQQKNRAYCVSEDEQRAMMLMWNVFTILLGTMFWCKWPLQSSSILSGEHPGLTQWFGSISLEDTTILMAEFDQLLFFFSQNDVTCTPTSVSLVESKIRHLVGSLERNRQIFRAHLHTQSFPGPRKTNNKYERWLMVNIEAHSCFGK